MSYLLEVRIKASLIWGKILNWINKLRSVRDNILELSKYQIWAFKIVSCVPKLIH